MSDPTAALGSAQHQEETLPKSPVYDLSSPILELGSGITIRHHRHSDAESLSQHASDPTIARQMSDRFPYPYTVDKSHDWIARCRDENNWRAIGPTDPKSKNRAGLGQKLPTSWIIAVNDKAVGGIGLQFQEDVFARTLEFGYWLGMEYRGKGIMTTVVKAMVEWVWKTYPWIVKLSPNAYAWNKGSQRVLEKCGFEVEGRAKCAVDKNGVFGDIVLFGMVRKGVVVTGEAPVIE